MIRDSSLRSLSCFFLKKNKLIVEYEKRYKKSLLPSSSSFSFYGHVNDLLHHVHAFSSSST